MTRGDCERKVFEEKKIYQTRVIEQERERDVNENVADYSRIAYCRVAVRVVLLLREHARCDDR